VKHIEGKRWILGLCLALFVAGCSGSNEIIDGREGPPGADAVTGVLQQVILPAIDKLAAFSPVNQPAPRQGDSDSSSARECDRFDPFCFSGGFEVCLESPGGPVTFRYERCARPVGLVDGAWVLARDGLSATADLELSIDALTLTGRISYALDDMCWESTFDSFAAAGPHDTTTLDGTVGYCFATGRKTGRLEIAVAGSRGSFDLSLKFEGGTGTIVVVHATTTTVCSLDMPAGTANCRTD